MKLKNTTLADLKKFIQEFRPNEITLSVRYSPLDKLMIEINEQTDFLWSPTPPLHHVSELDGFKLYGCLLKVV